MDRDYVALPLVSWAEILSGASKGDYHKLRRVLSAFPRYFLSRDSFDRIEQWIEIGIRHGQRFGIADLMIGITSEENRGSIWSLDKDFHRMKKLGFVQLFDPEDHEF